MAGHEELPSGDALLTLRDDEVRVERLETEPYSVDRAYNLTVTGPHTYHVGIAATLVHNCPGAVKSADDWPVLSGIVRDASKGKGNFGLGSGTKSQANRAGQAWVGRGYKVAGDGKTLISADGLRQWRPPSFKPNLGKWQSNFESRLVPRGQWQGNGHLDITDAQ